MRHWDRRTFLEAMGHGVVAAAVFGAGCTRKSKKSSGLAKGVAFRALPASDADELLLAEGLNFQVVLRYGEVLDAAGAKFGYNNDFIERIDLDDSGDEILLWVNHESVTPVLIHGQPTSASKTKEQVDLERTLVGGSLVHLVRAGNKWSRVPGSRYNRRIDATTAMPLIAPRPIAGERIAAGTLANCGGGKTPWGTILSCEENYDNFVGERDGTGKRVPAHPKDDLQWWKHYDLPPEHYGWVVEVNPTNGAAKKLTALGRFAHEAAAVRAAKDGRAVVYSGDDRAGGCLYKFIASQPGSLETGKLFVAELEKGVWQPLDHSRDELRTEFSDPLDVLIRARDAAKRVGGTGLDRPEDIAIEPSTGRVIVALTNNEAQGNLHGSLLALREADDDPLALTFSSEVLLSGGVASGISCPDNLTFDPRGNLWLTNDIADDRLGKGPYASFGNNSLYFIPMSGADAGKPVRVASGPRYAELTGPKFSQDGRTLFLSVQHPGNNSTSGTKTSHWPDEAGPIPCVVALRGPALDRLMDG